MFCSTCGRSRGPALLWKAALQSAEDAECSTYQLLKLSQGYMGESSSHVNIGKMAHEQGLLPCCLWGSTGASAHLMRRKRKREEVPDLLKEARHFLTPGNGLDRSFLDGYFCTDWYKRDILTADKRVCNLMLRALATSQAVAYQHQNSTVAKIYFQCQCTIDGANARTLAFPVLLPAPVGGYIVSANKRYGGRMCVNLKIAPKVNEIIPRYCGNHCSKATIILGPTKFEERHFSPQALRMTIEWRDGQIQAVYFAFRVMRGCKVTADQAGFAKVSLEHCLQTLFSLTAMVLTSTNSDIVMEEILSLVKESLLRRTYINLESGGTCMPDSNLGSCVEHFLRIHALETSNDEQRRNARAVIALFLRIPAGSLHVDTILQDILTCSDACSGELAMSEFATSMRRNDHVMDVLDMIARLLCSAIQIHANPECRESPEKNMDVKAPSAASTAALRYAIKNTLDAVVKNIKKEFSKLDLSSCDPRLPKINVKKSYANTPPHCSLTQSLTWENRDEPCPLCGTYVAVTEPSCSTCTMELRNEQSLFNSTVADIVVTPGCNIVWNSSYETLLQCVAYASLFAQHQSILNLTMRKLVCRAAHLSLPMGVLRHLKGSKKGVHASVPTDHKTSLRTTVNCVRSDDVTMTDATTVQTGINSSQIHTAWRRRRANRRYRGLWDTLFLHEKTTQHTRHAPPGILFASAALLDDEDERAVVEATLCAVLQVKKITESSTNHTYDSETFARVTLEGRSLRGSVTRWQKKTEELTPHLLTHPFMTNDVTPSHLGCDQYGLLTIEQSMRLPRLVREELDMRMKRFRYHEMARLCDTTQDFVRILKKVRLVLENGEEMETEAYTSARRLPAAGDYVRKNADTAWLQVVELKAIWVSPAYTGSEPYAVPIQHLRKVQLRQGDPCSLCPLAYINAVLAEHQRHIDVRLSGGHAVVLVQRSALKPSSQTSYAQLFEQFTSGQLGLWHASTLATEEHMLSKKTFLAHNAPTSTYLLPFHERQIRCARTNALPPPMGHGVRHGAHLRALGSSCVVWKGISENETETRTFPSRADAALLSSSSWSRGDMSITGSRADVTLLAVALVDDVDGTTYEDAGIMDRSVGTEQGRCFFTLTSVSAPTPSKILTPHEISEAGLAPKKSLLHLDGTGRGRGFVFKSTVLAWLRDGNTLIAPCDAWVEVWISNLREIPCVILVQEQKWVSGIKVVGLLQKSVLTVVNHGVSSPVPVSFVRAEASCVSRNAAATYVSALALKLLLARGARLMSQNSFKNLKGLRKVFLDEACNFKRIVAARDLTPGLCRYDTYPIMKKGRYAGRARVLYSEMNIPLDKSAPRVLLPHLGPGCTKTKGFHPSSGQALETTERAITTTALAPHQGRYFEVNRPEGQTGLLRADYVRACSSALELLDVGLLPA